MIRIEIIKDGAKTIIERNEIDPLTAVDDLMNILFVSGYELTDIEKSILSCAEEIKKNHKNEPKGFQNFSTL